VNWIAPLAEAAAAVDAVAAINTVGLTDLRTGSPSCRPFGGYSGPAILLIALAKVDEIVRETAVPVVGVGGIQGAAEALKFFALGAVAVQVGTAQMRDPFARPGGPGPAAPRAGAINLVAILFVPVLDFERVFQPVQPPARRPPAAGRGAPGSSSGTSNRPRAG
jgi:hypothetical protein